MLDYINNHFMTFTYWVAAGIEVTGVMHTSYLIRMMAYWAAGKPVESNEPPKTGSTFIFFWARVAFSLGVLGFALAVTIEALYLGKTSAWEGIPETFSLFLFLILMCCVGLLEGMQIAFFTVAKLPKSERGSSSMALRTCHCLFKDGGKNLPGFMCGRQMTVTLCFFIIARVTTVNVVIGVDENIFGVSDGIQKMLNLGFMGAITTTILGSIAWQLVASSFPIAFLSNPIVFVFLQAALLLEATGICYAAWFLAWIQRKAMGFQYDEVYVGTPEDRAAKNHADDTNAQPNLDIGTNVLEATMNAGLDMSWAEGDFTIRRTTILKQIAHLREQIKLSVTENEKAAFEHSLKLEVYNLKRINKDQDLVVKSAGEPAEAEAV
mmetsp:Transcript_4198/g.8667  ORF Transcript_4198/g.8667 Transcript_4198/m.8667 type:complete len:379 (+) Transcript_4198:2-1138(+)